MKTKILFFFIIVCTIMSSCSSDSEDSNQKNEFDGSIRSIRDFYNDDLVKALEDLGFIIYTGNTPPNLEGTFIFSPFKLEDSSVPNDNIGRIFSDYIATFTNQDNNSLTIDLSGKNGNQTDNGTGSFISGEGNQFSVFLKLTSQIGNVPVETALAISGEVTENGLKNIQAVNLMLDDKGDPEDVYIDNNTGRLFYDSDYISEKQ